MPGLSSTRAAPASPYVGVRTYGFDETGIFSGRDADVAQVGALVANRARWRIVLLHGQTGCGKSSFLKAGLIPQLTSPSFETAVFDRSPDASYSRFITSSADPMTQLAGVAVELARQAVPAGEWTQWLAHLDMAGDMGLAAGSLARSHGLMARWFEALAPRLNKPLLLVVDQAEELFTLRVDAQAEQAAELYFNFLAAFCDRSSWVQILISMRTEFYGRFDHELRRRLGAAMPVAPYYLQPFSAATLEAAVTEPLDQVFRTAAGLEYGVRFEPEVPPAVAAAVASRFPGPGALTALQIVCVRLCEQALAELPRPAAGAGRPTAVVTMAMFGRLGVLDNLIEDVIDQAVGDFCDARALKLADGLRLWRACKLALGSLVTRQSDGAPTTKFVLRSQFIDDFAQRTTKTLARLTRFFMRSLIPLQSEADDKQLAGELVVHLLQPHIRVLREVSVVEQGQTEPTHYLALGHDILSVGLAEAMARLALIDQRQSRESRRLFAKMLAIPLLIGLLAAALPLCAALLGVSMDTSLKALVTYGFYGLAAGFYVVMGYEAFSAKLPAGVVGFPKLLAEHVRRPVVVALDETPTAIVTKLFEPFAILRHFGAPMKASGLLFRAMTNDARREAAAEGQVVFPGGARY